MATYNFAVILKNPRNEAEFLLVKQKRPPQFGDEEYDSFADSDLWDLPSTRLNPLEGESEPPISIHDAESCSEMIELRKFDVNLALKRVLEQVVFGDAEWGNWRFWKFVEEAEFGPGPPFHTLFILGLLVSGDPNLQESCKWMSAQSSLNWLVDVKPNGDRIGPLVVAGLVNDSLEAKIWKVPQNLNYQEYPPGVTIVPMKSRTLKPFTTTNLIVFAPESPSADCDDASFVASGDALIVDPGCHSNLYEELKDIVSSLPKKLVVFITHHHHDHVDGLSVVQQCNPNAVLLAHENTMRRIGKDVWSLGYTSITGNEDICIGGQRLNVIFAPGHTDGHMGLLHVRTHSIVVGDHCVGQGSTILDVRSGGNMEDYFKTTYTFMELSPHALIPMHGRVNLWPKHMLCGYLKNRRSREISILEAIENGAHTLFEIIANVYSEVDRRFWIPASYNVRLHVDHLAHQDKLPKEFSIQKFQKTCGLHFFSRWGVEYLTNGFKSKYHKLRTLKLLIAGIVAGFAVLYSAKNKLIFNRDG
ncbi:uncharacterized protein LOC21398546 isoform X1 [Morus notabilis]|uniref:uncharacterized protein LOC21398546 isoform X1 n=1 Tax=Morus notabilis TaxID=981085 RepID=UPI000CED4152|nr:uncharacterized protein LOC21398546 isoform X1 [Morus notabilis]